jgi:endonuclease YncB( thermonuclease family)
MKQERRLAKLALAAILIALSATDRGVAQTENAPPARRATRPADIRVYRLRTPSSFFEQDAVHFQRAHVDLNGSLRADGHALQLYGAVLVPRNRICISPTGARWACGQRAFMAIRALLDGKSITCSFKHISEPPKAVCSIENSDVAQFLLSEGWAELAAGIEDKAYVEASESARSKGAGIWGDGPP